MKKLIFTLLAFASLSTLFSSCSSDDDSISPDGNRPVTGNEVPVYLSIDLTGFYDPSALKSTAEAIHHYQSSGYTIELVDVWNDDTGAFENQTLTNVDLTQPISVVAVEWFDMKISHPDYDGISSSKEAFYSYDDRIMVSEDIPSIVVKLELPQSFCYFIYEQSNIGEQISSQSIDALNTETEYEVVYIPSDKAFDVVVDFIKSDAITISNDGIEGGKGIYYRIMDQSVEGGIEFELPTFEDAVDGGDIG